MFSVQIGLLHLVMRLSLAREMELYVYGIYVKLEYEQTYLPTQMVLRISDIIIRLWKLLW